MHFSAEKLLSILGVMTSGLMVGRGQVSDPSHLFLTNSLFLFMVIQLPSTHGHPAPLSTLIGRRGTAQGES